MYRATSPPPVECPTWIAFFRSSASVSATRSSAYVSISLPSHVWVERPCPRRSWAMHRKPRDAKNIICASQSSALSGQPWLKTMGWPLPQSL